MKPGLALFDFDGTISNYDSASLFYKSLYSNKLNYYYRHLILCLPLFISYKFGIIDYLPLKRKRLQIHVGRLSQEVFNYRILNFQRILLPSIIKKSALECIVWHKRQKHDVFIVSASFDFLLSEWCRQQDICLIANQTKKEKDSIFFQVEDCNFGGKVLQIKKNIILENYNKIYAYGDSDGDHAMLSLANEAHLNYFI